MCLYVDINMVWLNEIGGLIWLVYLFNITTCLVTGILLLVIRSAPHLTERLYSRAKIGLAIATMIVGIGKAFILWKGVGNNLVDVFSLPALAITSLQACIFTLLFIILFHSAYATRRNIVKHLLPAIVLTVCYLITVAVIPDVKVYSVAGFFSTSEIRPYRSGRSLL